MTTTAARTRGARQRTYNTAGWTYTPTVSSTVQNVEASIIDCGIGGTAYNGYRYLQALVPLNTGGGQNLENPCINFSQDGTLWTASTVTNPVVAYPGGGAAGNNADPSLFDNRARDSKIYLTYVRENTTPLGNGGVFYKTSTDGGVTWSAETQLLVQTTGGAGADQYLEPKIEYDPTTGLYNLWYLDLAGGMVLNGAGALYRKTSSSPTSGWSASVLCTVPLPTGFKMWHWGAPRFIRGKWVTGFSDNHTNRRLWMMSSIDGLTWRVGDRPLIKPSLAGWDRGRLNRLNVQLADDGLNLYGWYNGASETGDNTWRLSPRINIPWGEVP